ncbi:L(+)-tartrate dehydratase subunit alpha [Alkalithermobacter paradoxus]|uniref:L(+)-tartrate dehydratase subunit alpha n=1 Tax=Alkalithermobacter paradoxus TaxID=29349 RepID=A0A1V4I6N3_9FIRM|nr:L(+)-tartrate dehydratase subunit alpha [[Clostridium] thermoalcaliphilum]
MVKKLRKIHVSQVTQAVKEMCISSNIYLGDDVISSLKKGEEEEVSPIGKEILDILIRNATIARENKMPICQDTGMVVVFLEVGQEVHFVGGNIEDAINEGVRQGYEEGYLRKSVVKDPITRENTKDNTPAVIHYNIVPGDKVKITVAPKGFGSENMSRIKMLKPSDGIKGIEDFVVETVSVAGGNPCPPIIVGVGIGGTIEKAAYIAKKSLLRPIGQHSRYDHIKDMEIRLLEKINNLGIGPQGLGGKTTALGVNIEIYPTHIASLPVVVNINCHASRHEEKII